MSIQPLGLSGHLTRSVKSYSHGLSQASDVKENDQKESRFIFKHLIDKSKIKIGAALFDEAIDYSVVVPQLQREFLADFGKDLDFEQISYCKRYLDSLFRLFLGTNLFEPHTFNLDAVVVFVLEKNLFKCSDSIAYGLKEIIDCFVNKTTDIETIKSSIDLHSKKIANEVACQYIVEFISKISLPSSILPFKSIDELNGLIGRKIALVDTPSSQLCQLFREIFVAKMPEVSGHFTEELNLLSITKKNYLIDPFFNAPDLADKLGVLWGVYHDKRQVYKFSFVETIAMFMRNMNSTSKVHLQPFDYMALTFYGLDKHTVWQDVVKKCEFFIKTQNRDMDLFIDQLQMLFFLKILETNNFFSNNNSLYYFINRYDRFFSFPYPTILDSSSPLSIEFYKLILSLKDLDPYTIEEMAHFVKSSFEGLDKKSAKFKILHFEYKTIIEDNVGLTEDTLIELLYKNYIRLTDVWPTLETLGKNHQKIIHALVLYFSGVFKSHEPIVDYARATGHLQFIEHRKIMNYEAARSIAIRADADFDAEKMRDEAILWQRNKDCIYAWFKIFLDEAPEIVEKIKTMRAENPCVAHKHIIKTISEEYTLDGEEAEQLYKTWWFQGDIALKSFEFGLRDKESTVVDLALEYCCIEVYSHAIASEVAAIFNVAVAMMETQLIFEEKYPDFIFNKFKCRQKIEGLFSLKA